MDRHDKVRRLKSLLTQVAPGPTVESLPPSTRVASPPPGTEDLEEGVLESVSLEGPAAAAEISDETIESAIGKVAEDRELELTPEEEFALEAIVLPKTRPVVFVRADSYDDLPDPWLHLNDTAVRSRIAPLTRAIGRVEVPNLPTVPFGGTAFVVGKDLLMTNRHVAELFTEGLGTTLRYTPGDAEVDFLRRFDTLPDDQSALFRVSKVEMIHPYWDMALLRVDGLHERVSALPLSVLAPEELVDRDVVIVGYPARDFRNDLELQDRIFARTYNVKRLQPGKIRPRDRVTSFRKVVEAMTHDGSTLGGNSGSAVIDVETGQVIGLHFAGIYLKANYAVSTYDLARDRRVTRLGLNFDGAMPAPTTAWDGAWPSEREQPASGTTSSPSSTMQSPPSTAAPRTPASAAGTSQWTIPIHVSITLGQPAGGGVAVTQAEASAAAAGTEAPGLRMPIIYGGLENRKGYQPGFLDLDDDEDVPLPKLTSAGRTAAAKLDDGSTELKYHKFSVVMHKGRRLAMFTAANVDWREEVRKIGGRKPSRAELRGFRDGAEQWTTDWRIDEKHQLPDIFFTDDDKMFDKGHLVRRDDVCWGKTFRDMQKANGDTYHTTNCSPQVAGFNQATEGKDNWGDLENLVQKETKAERAILFSGPVLDEDDPIFRGKGENGEKLNIRIPRRFWKIIVVKGEHGPDAYGFVLEQDLSAIEFAVPAAWKRYVKSVEEIEEMLQGLVDLSWLKKHDRADSEEGVRIAEQV